MKTRIIHFAIVALTLVIFISMPGCTKRDNTLPTASFTYTSTKSLPATAHFVNLSTGVVTGTTFSWDFGDGGTSTAINPDHLYLNQGTYTVTLTQTAPAGPPETVTQALVVSTTGPSGISHRPQSPQFTVSITYGVPYLVTFTNNSTEADIYHWNFGDNTTSQSGSSTVTHTYNTPGPHYVLLTATNSNGMDTSGVEIRF